MAYTDMHGLPVSTTSATALASYEEGVTASLRWRSGALEALQAAVEDDPRFILGHCAHAYVAWRMGKFDTALQAHQQVMALADHAYDEREHLHVQTVDAMQQSNSAAALEHLERLVETSPTDRMAMRLLSIMYIARGDYQRGLEQARWVLAVCPNDVQFQTMGAFFLEQSNTDPDEGLVLGLRALASDPGSLYTYHAVGHNYQQRGDYPKVLATFERANSLERYAHNLWHLAEAQAILGDTRITRDYWASSAPPLPLFERIELLWRLELLRRETADIDTWKTLAAQGERLLEHAAYLTIWMHHWIGLALARAGETEKAQQQLLRLCNLADGKASGHWSTLGADLLAGEMAFMSGDTAAAVQLMAPAIERLHDMGGGSREQKDIFQDIYMELQRRLGNVEVVTEVAQRRLRKNPNHMQSLAALAWAYQQNGQTALQHQTYQQLLSRAEHVSAAAESPAVVEARQALQALN